jgi:hypothetical protein
MEDAYADYLKKYNVVEVPDDYTVEGHSRRIWSVKRRGNRIRSFPIK